MTVRNDQKKKKTADLIYTKAVVLELQNIYQVTDSLRLNLYIYTYKISYICKKFYPFKNLFLCILD